MQQSNWLKWLSSDARHFQILSQFTFLIYGILFLGWDQDWLNYAAAFTGTVGIQTIFIKTGYAQNHSYKSAIITALGLCLLLKTNSPIIFFCAGAIAIAQKFAIRINGKHLWNPANFGIIIAIILSGNAWVSPGQWGNQAVFVLVSSVAAWNVLSRIGRIDTGIIFLLSLSIFEYFRTVVYLEWGHEVWLHKMTSGSILLFSFFMITDPMSTPFNKKARIVWTVSVAFLSFYLTNFFFINASVQWVLFALTPFTPLIDKLAKASQFNWQKSIQPLFNLKKQTNESTY
jgi:Na+-transporting NADH:ubiquinone oxidoreductase subunit NqrB